MIICPRCNGDGVITFNKMDKNGYFNDAFFMKECSVCHGTGEVLTNDEWRKTCSTEEYATWLWKNFDHGEVIILWEKYGCPMYKDDNGVSRADYTEAMKKWLEEKHDGNT